MDERASFVVDQFEDIMENDLTPFQQNKILKLRNPDYFPKDRIKLNEKKYEISAELKKLVEE